jgi:hypothetical protein
MIGHKFKVGQAVEYSPPKGFHTPRGAYFVTATLPERSGEFEYHIRNAMNSSASHGKASCGS